METYLVYNFILLGATFFAFGYQTSKSRVVQSFCYGLAFFIPFIFLAIRYDIGMDYQGYVRYFYRIADGEFILKEPAYILVNKIIAEFRLDVQWFFVVFGFFFLYFIYKAIPKEGFAIGIFLFISIMYLYEGFSAVRQGLAVAIMAYAMRYIYNRQFVRYLCWAFVAMSFHFITGLLLLAIYPLGKVKINKVFSIAMIIALFFIVQYTGISQILLTKVGALFPKYAWYINSQFSGGAKTAYGLLGPLIKVSIVIFILLFKDRIVRKNPKANLVLNLLMLYIIGYIFNLKVSIFTRVEHIFIFSIVLSIVYFINTFSKQMKLFLMVGLLSFYYMMFMRYIANGTLEVDNDAYINPYQTILFKKGDSAYD